MKEIRFTLLADGTSDRALMPILEWLLNQHFPNLITEGAFADFRFLPCPPQRNRLDLRINKAIDLFPCDILFIHRDAENIPWEKRHEEISSVLKDTVVQGTKPIPVIPVKMTEAWLLFDESAIKTASGNRRGPTLSLPSLKKVDTLPDPKEVLIKALKDASGLSGRRLARFDERSAVTRVAELIDDFSPLRALEAFRKLEIDIKKMNWDT